jgi:fatty acid desaturase
MADALDPVGAYAELRRAVIGARLLERAYPYYIARAGVSFLILAMGVSLAFVLPPSAPTLVVAAAVMAFGSVQVALIGHDAGHLAVFQRRFCNHLLGSICWSLALGISFRYWNDRHNRHHAGTNDVVADPDLQWSSIVAYSVEMASTHPRRSKWLSRHQAIVGPLISLLLPFAFRLEGWRFVFCQLRGSAGAAEVLLLATSTVAWLFPTAALGWWWIGVFTLGQVLAGLYLSLAIAPNHIGMHEWPSGAPLSFIEHQLLSTRNVAPGRVVDFVFGGLNYQIEHHLFPTMPRNHLARARKLVKPFCAARGLAYTEMAAFDCYRLVATELRRVGRVAAA